MTCNGMYHGRTSIYASCRPPACHSLRSMLRSLDLIGMLTRILDFVMLFFKTTWIWWKYSMGSKFETLQRDIFIFDHNLNTSATIVEDQSRGRIDLRSDGKGQMDKKFGISARF